MRLLEINSDIPDFSYYGKLEKSFYKDDFDKSNFKKFITLMYRSRNYPVPSLEDAKKFINQFGINSKNTKGAKTNWSGKILYLKGLDGSEIFHEVCHWIIASIDRKPKPEFGLGRGFATSDFDYANKFKDNSVDDQFEEIATCFLGAAWEFHYGRNALKGLCDTNFIEFYFGHSDNQLNIVTIEEIKKYDEVLNFLISNHLMNANFEPNYFVRI